MPEAEPACFRHRVRRELVCQIGEDRRDVPREEGVDRRLVVCGAGLGLGIGLGLGLGVGLGLGLGLGLGERLVVCGPTVGGAAR